MPGRPTTASVAALGNDSLVVRVVVEGHAHLDGLALVPIGQGVGGAGCALDVRVVGHPLVAESHVVQPVLVSNARGVRPSVSEPTWAAPLMLGWPVAGLLGGGPRYDGSEGVRSAPCRPRCTPPPPRRSRRAGNRDTVTMASDSGVNRTSHRSLRSSTRLDGLDGGVGRLQGMVPQRLRGGGHRFAERPAARLNVVPRAAVGPPPAFPRTTPSAAPSPLPPLPQRSARRSPAPRMLPPSP